MSGFIPRARMRRRCKSVPHLVTSSSLISMSIPKAHTVDLVSGLLPNSQKLWRLGCRGTGLILRTGLFWWHTGREPFLSPDTAKFPTLSVKLDKLVLCRDPFQLWDLAMAPDGGRDCRPLPRSFRLWDRVNSRHLLAADFVFSFKLLERLLMDSMRCWLNVFLGRLTDDIASGSPTQHSVLSDGLPTRTVVSESARCSGAICFRADRARALPGGMIFPVEVTRRRSSNSTECFLWLRPWWGFPGIKKYTRWRHQMEHFPRYWPFVRGIHRSPVNSPYKGQWRGALMFSLICTRINGWVNNGEAGDLRRHRARYDVTVLHICILDLKMNTLGGWTKLSFAHDLFKWIFLTGSSCILIENTIH